MPLDENSRTILQAVGKVLKERLPAANGHSQEIAIPTKIQVQSPEVTVINEVPEPHITVNVDLQPVANALDKFADAMNHQAELLGQLIQVLANQQRPVIRMPKPKAHSFRLERLPDGSKRIIQEE